MANRVKAWRMPARRTIKHSSNKRKGGVVSKCKVFFFFSSPHDIAEAPGIPDVLWRTPVAMAGTSQANALSLAWNQFSRAGNCNLLGMCKDFERRYVLLVVKLPCLGEGRGGASKRANSTTRCHLKFSMSLERSQPWESEDLHSKPCEAKNNGFGRTRVFWRPAQRSDHSFHTSLLGRYSSPLYQCSCERPSESTRCESLLVLLDSLSDSPSVTISPSYCVSICPTVRVSVFVSRS